MEKNNNPPPVPVRDTIDYIQAATALFMLPDSKIKDLLIECLEAELTPVEYITVEQRAIELGKTGNFDNLLIFVRSQLQPVFTENMQLFFEAGKTLDDVIHQFYQ